MIVNKLAAKILLVFTLGLVSACGLVFLPKAKATTILGNADPMSRACVDGYTRVLGNFCKKTHGAYPPTQTLTLDNTCRNVNVASLYFVPTSATLVSMKIGVKLTSTNAVGLKQATFDFYSDSACTIAPLPTHIYNIREFANVAAGTTLLIVQPVEHKIIPVSGLLYYKGTLTTCTNCVLSVFIDGYYD